MAVRFAIANENRPVLDLQDTRIGDSHSEDVRGKVLQACFAGAYGLGIDIPVDLPDIGRDLIEEAGFFHSIAKLGLEDLRESPDGEIKIDPGGVPEAIGGGEGAAGDDVMDMGVKLEGTPPGVEDAEEPREICADIMFIQSKLLNSFGGSLEQGRVGYPLVFANEAAQVLRDGKREQEMVTGELPFHLFFEPLPALVVLTSGAMAISTGAMDPVEVAALLALIQGDPASLGAAGDDGIHDLAV